MRNVIDMTANNHALCSFGHRWKIDGDYIRCGTCDRPQITSYANHDFPHADFCREKDSPIMERRPWLTYAELLSPIIRATAAPVVVEEDDIAKVEEDRKRQAEREDAMRYRWLRDPPLMAKLPAWIAGQGNKYIDSDWLTGERADKAIDAVRTAALAGD